MKRRDGNPEMDTLGSPERFPGPTDGPLRREDDTVVAAQVKTIFRLIPSPGEQPELFELLQRLHPADARNFVENLLLVNPAPALQTQPGPLCPDCDTVVTASVLYGAVSVDCDTVVAASVLCGAVSADSPKFGCDSGDCFYETPDSSDCSDFDDYDELDCFSDVCGDIDSTYYAPTNLQFIHELHGPDNCGVYCQLRYEIRPYGCFAP